MKRLISYQQAINEAIIQEMGRDETVFIYGIDVADHLRTFGTGAGVLEQFGKNRCFSTPLSEDAMTGFGLGASITGLRPIHIHIRIDFLTLALNQLSNMISSFRYGSGNQQSAPMVIRAVVGRGWGQSYQHSKSLHSVFAHLPGLRVIFPSTPQDAKGMLIAAIRKDDPVLMIEHRWLYYQRGYVEENPYEASLTGCRVLREGNHVTVAATSWMNIEALAAADLLKKHHGIEIEVVDVRAANPLDDSVLIDSVLKTKYCIVADNDWVHCGLASEIASRVAEKAFGELRAPVEKMGFAFAPCPSAQHLEVEYYAGAKDIVRKVEANLGLKQSPLKETDFPSYENNQFKGPF